jgi:hypothetical protein
VLALEEANGLRNGVYHWLPGPVGGPTVTQLEHEEVHGESEGEVCR